MRAVRSVLKKDTFACSSHDVQLGVKTNKWPSFFFSKGVGRRATIMFLCERRISKAPLVTRKQQETKTKKTKR